MAMPVSTGTRAPLTSSTRWAEVYVKYRYKALTVEPFYAFEYTWLGGQPYSMYNDAGLRLTLQETKRLSGDLVYMFQYRSDKSYITEPNQRSL